MKKIKVNDQVEVIAGKDKGMIGKIIGSFRDKDRVIVEKVNMIKRHTKPSQANQQGGIIEKESAIHVSNVMLVCPKCSKPTRIAPKVLDDGMKVRVCKKCGESVEAKA